MRKIFLLFIFLLLQQIFKAQFMDTLTEVFKNKRSFDLRYESRISFFNNGLITINGIRLGIAFQRKLRIGGGFSWLDTDLKSTLNPTDKNYLKIAYLCYYLEFVFYKDKHWQLSVPIQLGTGLKWDHDATKNYFTSNEKFNFLALYEPGISIQYKIFKWVGLGTDIAYRFTLINDKSILGNLNSPTFSFKILFWPDQLFFDFFLNSRITKKYGPSFW